MELYVVCKYSWERVVASRRDWVRWTIWVKWGENGIAWIASSPLITAFPLPFWPPIPCNSLYLSTTVRIVRVWSSGADWARVVSVWVMRERREGRIVSNELRYWAKVSLVAIIPTDADCNSPRVIESRWCWPGEESVAENGDWIKFDCFDKRLCVGACGDVDAAGICLNGWKNSWSYWTSPYILERWYWVTGASCEMGMRCWRTSGNKGVLIWCSGEYVFNAITSVYVVWSKLPQVSGIAARFSCSRAVPGGNERPGENCEWRKGAVVLCLPKQIRSKWVAWSPLWSSGVGWTRALRRRGRRTGRWILK